MANFRYLLHLAVLMMCLPGVGRACDYPGPLQKITATLVSVQDTGGQVATFHRARLRQALGQIDARALADGLAGTLGRAERRSVAAVLTVSAALADGRGLALTEQDRDHVRVLAKAIHADCAAATAAQASAGADAATPERDTAARDGGRGSGLTFREGLTRLSFTFTIYLICLTAVIWLRRWHKVARLSTERADDQPAPTLDTHQA